MKHLLSSVLLLICISTFAMAQSEDTIKKALHEVNGKSDLDKLMAGNPNWNGEYLVIDLTDSILDERITSLKPGEYLRITESGADYVYKLIDSQLSKEFRASYIYLSGSQLSKDEIDSIRTLIITKLKKGKSFESLANKYTMDRNKTGDLGWFRQGMMVKEFEQAVSSHKKGDVFTVDVDSNGWYYVVSKTYDDKIGGTIELVRVKLGK